MEKGKKCININKIKSRKKRTKKKENKRNRFNPQIKIYSKKIPNLHPL